MLDVGRKTHKKPKVGPRLLRPGSQRFSSFQVFDPVSASDTGEYICQAQNGYGTSKRSDAVRMEAGEQGSAGQGRELGPGVGVGTAFHPGFGGGGGSGSEPSGH